MSLRKGLLIFVLSASEIVFIGCSKQGSSREFDVKNEEKKQIPQILISEFDPIMRREAAQEELDWRFIAAICYHESRFKNEVVSPAGAVGVMQVMPSVARSFGVSADSIRDPEVNIATAVKILKAIESSMRFSSAVSKEDRMKITLACYNGGIGHILDACRLAAKYGANYTRWEELEKFVRIKGTPDYVNDEAVKCGQFYCEETINFVNVVMSQYKYYCNKYPA